MAGWYEIHKSSNGQFRFVLKTEGADTLLTSELYQSKTSAEGGIASVQKNCSHDELYERKDAAGGKHYFNLKATNHQIIATSPMHATAAARDADIAAVKTNGPSTEIRDQS